MILLSLRSSPSQRWCHATGIAGVLLARFDFGQGCTDAMIYPSLVLPPVVTGYLLCRLTWTVGAWLADTLGIVRIC